MNISINKGVTKIKLTKFELRTLNNAAEMLDYIGKLSASDETLAKAAETVRGAVKMLTPG